MERRTFEASDHVRPDWTEADCIYFLEGRARGYNGMLRATLCTSAALLRRSETLLKEAEAQLKEVEAQLQKAEEAQDEATPVVSKRNQQPGRLSGSEREALKKFVILAQATDYSQADQRKVLAEGRAMLAKVRKRALGDHALDEADPGDGS